MPLTDRAILEIDEISGSDNDAAFVLTTDLEASDEVTRNFVLSERGQWVREAADILPESITDPIDGDGFDRREGYHIDGGAGTDSIRLQATRGVEEQTQWGDGSADGSTTQYDAVPGDLEGQIDVLKHWLSETRSDSGGQTRLYIRHHSDGTYADEPGAFGEPITVAVEDLSISKDDHSEFSITLEMTRTATFPDVRGALDDIQDAIDDVVSELGDYMPDF